MALTIPTNPQPVYQRAFGANRLKNGFTFVYNDSVGGVTVDGGFIDSASNPVPGANGPLGVSVQGNNTILLDMCPGGPYSLKVYDRNNAGNNAVSSSFLIGDVWAYSGQSNASGMWTAAVSPPTPYSVTKMYSGGAWVTPTGNGLITLLNKLAERAGIPQMAICAGLGSTSLTYDGTYNYPGGTSGWHLDFANSPFTILSGAISILGGKCAGLVWDQSESDSVGVKADVYCHALIKYWVQVCSLVTDRAPPAFRFYAIEPGYFTSAAGSDQYPVRRGTAKFCDIQPGAKVIATRYDLPRDSGNVHLDPTWGYGLLGERIANAVAHDYYLLG